MQRRLIRMEIMKPRIQCRPPIEQVFGFHAWILVQDCDLSKNGRHDNYVIYIYDDTATSSRLF